MRSVAYALMTLSAGVLFSAPASPLLQPECGGGYNGGYNSGPPTIRVRAITTTVRLTRRPVLLVGARLLVRSVLLIRPAYSNGQGTMGLRRSAHQLRSGRELQPCAPDYGVKYRVPDYDEGYNSYGHYDRATTAALQRRQLQRRRLQRGGYGYDRPYRSYGYNVVATTAATVTTVRTIAVPLLLRFTRRLGLLRAVMDTATRGYRGYYSGYAMAAVTATAARRRTTAAAEPDASALGYGYAGAAVATRVHSLRLDLVQVAQL